MILNSTLKSIRVVLGEATTTNECDVTASWGDYAGTQFVPGAADASTNGTTPVEIVAAPGASEQRLCQEITVFNADTVLHTVILQLDNNGTIRVFRHQEIPVGGMLIYSPGGGEDAVNTAPAVLLETGTVGEKISALPAATLAFGDFTLTDPFPGVQGSATVQVTLAQLYQLVLDLADFVTGNPLNAAAASNDPGLPVALAAGIGDGTGAGGSASISGGLSGAGATGDGGAITLTAGASAATDGAGGAISLTSGAGAGAQNGGDISVTLGAGGTTGAGGNWTLSAGAAGSGATGGNVFADGGHSGSGAGGTTFLVGGNGDTDGAGGDISLTPGAGAGVGRAGQVIVILPTADPTVSGALWVDPVTHLVHQSP